MNKYLIVLPLALCSLAVFAQPSVSPTATTSPMSGAGNKSGIEGTISISPVHGGPIRRGEESSRPLPKTEFVVQNEKGEIASFTTDEQGKFSVVLSPGHYSAVKKGHKGGIGRFGPFEFDVTAGQMTKVDWHCDSGMR